MPSEEEKTLFRTLAFFSFFAYPLTVFELWKWQCSPTRVLLYAEVLSVLEQSTWLREQGVVRRGAYIALEVKRTLDEQILLKEERYVFAVQKYADVFWFVRYAAWIFGVQGIAFCNSLVLHFTRKESDADVFFLARPGLLWNVRFFSLLPLMLLGRRPKAGRTRAIDANFFLSEDALSVESLSLPGGDPYLAWWVLSLVPVFERDVVFERFFAANAWAREVFPVAFTARRVRWDVSFFSRSVLFLPRRVVVFLQLLKLPRVIRERMNAGTDILVNDSVLKFHKNDRRLAVRTWYEQQLQRAGIF